MDQMSKQEIVDFVEGLRYNDGKGRQSSWCSFDDNQELVIVENQTPQIEEYNEHKFVMIDVLVNGQPRRMNATFLSKGDLIVNDDGSLSVKVRKGTTTVVQMKRDDNGFWTEDCNPKKDDCSWKLKSITWK